MNEYDVLIIGAGQAGIPLARRLADEKRRVAIAERKHLGGSCVNFGCSPTKAVLASAHMAHQVRRAEEYGVLAGPPRIDFAKVIGRARDMVEASREGLAKGLDECGAEVLRGHARFTGRDGDAFTLAFGDAAVKASRVVIDTGTRTHLPKIEGLDRVPYVHASNWLDLSELPEHVVFAGGGYIALEMAQFYRRLGSAVTVIVRGDQVAGHEDADVANAMQKLLEAEGIVFRLNRSVTAAEPTRHGVRVTFSSDEGDGAKAETVEGSHLFLATGRRPNTDELGLETIGLTTDEQGVIAVDERLATAVPGVWAAGDVRGEPMFTHSAWDDHRVLESQLLGDGKRTTAGRVVPYAIFTDPELGRVGMTATQAREAYGEHAKSVVFDMKQNGKARQQGHTAGFIKLVADRRDGRLLGAAVLATEGAELVGSYITLMNTTGKLGAMCGGMYIHPARSEAVQSAASALDLKLHSTLTAKS